MRINLQPATAGDVVELLDLRAAVNRRLAYQFGEGFWIAKLTEKSILFAMRRSSVYLVRHRNKVVATLTLSTRKPWAIDAKYFSKSKTPLYLTSMAVDPGHQRKGLGRRCIEEVRRLAAEWSGDAIRLDAYDVAAGAGEFYRKCSFRMMGSATYRGVPLVYYEMLL